MTLLERKKMELELMRVKTAKMDLELKIEEMKEDIIRLTMHVDIQIKKEKELALKLNN
jgi:hypothetical protein